MERCAAAFGLADRHGALAGGHFLVNSASELARWFGFSEVDWRTSRGHRHFSA
ncbi:MAG: hypothetical protein R2911_31200 [Caldilineaceae bacterium]